MEYPVAPLCHLFCLQFTPMIYHPQSYVDDSQVSISFPLESLTTSLSYIKEDLLKIAEWCCQKSQQDKNSFVKKSSTNSTVNDHNKALQVDLFSHSVRTENKLYCACRIQSGA